MIQALPWGCRVVAMTDAYVEDGMRRDRAFTRALEACREPGAVLVPEEPTPRWGGPRRPAEPRVSVHERTLEWLREQRRPVTSRDLAEALELDMRSACRHLQILHHRGEAREVGVRAHRYKPVRLWVAA